MYLRKKINEQCGFTFTEILVALMILAVALVPVTGMFDTAVKGLITSQQVKDSMDCATTALEQISAMPFYKPYNEEDGDVDIDDHFWGDRNPIYLSPITGDGAPDWTNIPQVLAKDYGATPVFAEQSSLDKYKGCKVLVSLAYLNDNTGAVAMNSSWGPKLSGKDQPLADDNTNPHLLLIHISVLYQANGEEHEYILEQIVTDTQAIYGVGIKSLQVKGPDANLPPENYSPYNTGNVAMHWPNNNVHVYIDGWGFDPGTITAYLVRNKYQDIEISLSSKSEGVLEGTVNLYSTGTAGVTGEIDVSPRAGIGYWSVKIQQEGIINAYLFNGFICSFPKPVIADFYNGTTPGSRTGLNQETAQQITITGGPFPYRKDTGGAFIWKPNVSLVPANGTTGDRIIGTVTNVTGSNNGYTASAGCTITATFDLTQGEPGDYQIQVWNTDAAQVGHVSSDPTPGFYTIEKVHPIVTDVYVSGTNPHQTNIFKNLGNPVVRLEIIGNYFNTVTGPPYVRAYLYPSVAGAGQAPGATLIEGNVINVTTTDITAEFVPADLDLGDYNVYVVNQDADMMDGYITASTPRIHVIDYNGNITGFTCNRGAFYENYFDYRDGPIGYYVTGTITGTSLLDVTNVSIKDVTTGTEYADMNYTINSSTSITLYLNLIGCDHTHQWQVQAHVRDYILSYPFSVTLGQAIILPQNNFGDIRAAIYIDRGSSAYPYSQFSYETVAYEARAKRSGTGIFHVRGMGFPINNTTTLRIWGWFGYPSSYSGNYSCSMDRAGKIVSLVSDQWAIDNNSGYYEISVQAPGFGADTENNRWRITNNGN